MIIGCMQCGLSCCRFLKMPVSTMDQKRADVFDSEKAYRAQEEGAPFVSNPHLSPPRAVG